VRFPDFLIIGAMKAGTTSMYRDLRTHPRIFMPRDKEAGHLRDDGVLTDDGRARYARLFEPAGADQVCGEAPTDYTKLPDVPGVPARARAVAGPDLRAIYLVREPVARIVSHHYHEFAAGRMPANIDDAVRDFPELVNYSRYAMQLAPWIETFGRDHVHVVRFEDYVTHRRDAVVEVTRFLGLEPRPDLVQDEKVFNRSDGKPVMKGPLVILRRNPIYSRLVRPLLPLSARDALRRALMPKAPPRPDPPTAATVASIIEQLRDDLAALPGLLDAPDPLWDLEAVLRKSEAVEPSPRAR
jgi:hypothetical protein